MPHHDDRYATITYEPDLDAVYVEWTAPGRGEDFRTVLNAGLELVRREGAENWLADLRELGTVHPDDQEWSNDEWFPRALETPLSNMAIVRSENFVDQLSVENIMEEVADGALTSHYFDDEREAREWLGRRSSGTD